MSIAHHIGLEIAGRSLRLVEMQSKDGFPVILRTEVAKCLHPFGSALFHELPYDANLAKSFITSVSRLLYGRPVYSNSISVVLSHCIPAIAVVPLPSNYTSQESEEELRWQCKTLLGLSPDADVTVLSSEISQTATSQSRTLAVALSTAGVTFLREMFEHLTLSVTAIGVDHFVIESGVQMMFPPTRTGAQGVIGLCDHLIFAGMFEQGAYLEFAAKRISSNEQTATEAIRVLERFLQQHPTKQIQHLYLYGKNATEHVASELRALLHIPVDVFSPLKRFPFASGSDKHDAASLPDHVFNSALCAAWSGVLR